MQFVLVYPFTIGSGEMSANVGKAIGEAKINGDTAIYSMSEEGGKCKIKIKFVKPGQIKVAQMQEGAGCGFGLNVSAQGTYQKVSTKPPTFKAVE